MAGGGRIHSLDSDSLLGLTGNSLAIGLTSRRPTGLEDKDFLAGADLLGIGDLGLEELAGLSGIATTIAPANTLPLAEEALIDGSVTLTMKYL